MKIFVDIDGTICLTDGNDYRNSEPLPEKIAIINKLYDEGHEITYWSSRGNDSGRDWMVFTEHQLRTWGCKYNNLWLSKPSYDIFYEDKSRIL